MNKKKIKDEEVITLEDIDEVIEETKKILEQPKPKSWFKPKR